jgi:hypothetical protein
MERKESKGKEEKLEEGGEGRKVRGRKGGRKERRKLRGRKEGRKEN